MYLGFISLNFFIFNFYVSGEVSTFVKLEHLLKRKTSWNESEREAKEGDLDLLKKFIFKTRPHCIVVGSADRAALAIKEDIEGIVNDLVSDEQFPKLKVTYISDNLARVYANSTRAEADMREYPTVLRQAVSLGKNTLFQKSNFCPKIQF